MPGIESSGKLTKIKIQAYAAPDFKTKGTISETLDESVLKGEFTALLNPESYSESFEVELNENRAFGDIGSDLNYVNTKPQSLTLKFLFDGTGVVQKNTGVKLLNSIRGNEFKIATVKDQISDFKKIAFKFEGQIHQPHYLKINWGSLEFRGKLKKMDVNYTLFTPAGDPLRAVITAEFVEFADKKMREALRKTNSPDLSHYRIIKGGDTLPLLTEEIYGDAKYYLQVAKVNKLLNFRELPIGTKLIFPPIEKISN